MRAKAISQDQRALCALFALVTTDLPRSRDSVAIGNPPRFAWATASVASRVGSCPTVCGGRRCGRCPCPTPLPIGSMASISIKGEGFARHPHPFGARPAGCAPRAASGVALDADSSQDTATAPTWTGTKNPARWPGRRIVTNQLTGNPRHWRQLSATWWRGPSPMRDKDSTYGNAKVA
nr:hypothetical protein [bacterium]